MNDPVTHLVEKIIDGKYDLKEKKALLNEVRKIMAPEQNRWNFRFAIWTLALLALSIPIIILINHGASAEDAVPEGLLSLGSAAVGALAAFLTPYTQRTQGAGTTDSANPSADAPASLNTSGMADTSFNVSGLSGSGYTPPDTPGTSGPSQAS